MDVDKLFKELVWDSLVAAALKKLFAAVPWLGWGPLGIIVTWIGGMVADSLYETLKLTVNFQLIVLRNKEHAKEFAAAALTLREIGISKGIDSPEFRKARDAYKIALDRFVSFA